MTYHIEQIGIAIGKSNKPVEFNVPFIKLSETLNSFPDSGNSDIFFRFLIYRLLCMIFSN